MAKSLTKLEAEMMGSEARRDEDDALRLMQERT